VTPAEPRDLPPRVVLATTNPDKVAEWRAIAPEVGWVPRPDLPEPDETGATCAENALLKARATAEATGLPALGDDVGLFVDVWGGRPGVDLKPWALSLGGWGGARAALAGVAGARATYVCAVALAWPDGRARVVDGVVSGRVGPADGHGPGVEPCFTPDGHAASLSRLAPDERAAAHHRHRAWALLRG
jgi:XTP/dITP diphosphohydrolase